MKSKFYLFLAALITGMVMLSASSFADLSTSDVYELDNATPGTQKINAGAGLGHMLQGSRMTQVYTGTVDGNSPNTTVTGYRIVKWNFPSASGWSMSLGSGLTGQHITIIKNTTDTKPGKITPVTKTGFTDITLTNQGDGVTLEWHDATGWMPIGTFGTSTNTGKVNP